MPQHFRASPCNNDGIPLGPIWTEPTVPEVNSVIIDRRLRQPDCRGVPISAAGHPPPYSQGHLAPPPAGRRWWPSSPKASKAAKATTARVAGTGQSLFAFFVLITPFSPCNRSVGKQPDCGPALPVRFWYKQLVLLSLLQSRAARQGLSGVVGSRRRRWARPRCSVS